MNPVKITSKERITRGERNYAIDNYLTAEKSKKISVAISHLRGKTWTTKNSVSDRVYYLLKGKGEFKFKNQLKINAKKGDVLFIPVDTLYSMEGNFDAVLINTPAFNIINEIRL